MQTPTPEDREAYLQVLVNLSEITRVISSMLGVVFPNNPRIVPGTRMGLDGSLEDISRELANRSRTGPVSVQPMPTTSNEMQRATRRKGARAARRRVTRPATRRASRPRAVKRADTDWVGEARKAYQAVGSAEGLKLSKAARAVWEAIAQPLTGKQITAATGIKRKQVEKSTGELNKLGLLRTIDLTSGQLNLAT